MGFKAVEEFILDGLGMLPEKYEKRSREDWQRALDDLLEFVRWQPLRTSGYVDDSREGIYSDRYRDVAESDE